MRATALCCALAAIGCQSEAPAPEPPAAPPVSSNGPKGPPLGADGQPILSIAQLSGCQDYLDLPEVYGFCLVQWAGRGQGRRSVDEMCSEAGDWEDECRVAWVTSRAGEHSHWETDLLLDACPPAAGDCRFEVLDKRPNRDVSVQIQLCFERARAYSGDCVAHALERWVRTRPSPDEIETVAQSAIAPDRIGQYVATLKVCFGIIDECVGSEAVVTECERRLDQLVAKPEVCERLVQSPAIPQVPMGP